MFGLGLEIDKGEIQKKNVEIDYCTNCGHKVSSLSQEGNWQCPECGKFYGNDKYGEKKVLDEFLNNIESEWKKAKEFQHEIEREIRNIAIEIESGLKTAMITQKEIKLNSIRYRTDNFDKSGPENLVTRSLLLAFKEEEKELIHYLERHRKSLKQKQDSSRGSKIKIIEEIIKCFNELQKSGKSNSAYKNAFTSGGEAFYRGAAKSIGVKKLPSKALENKKAPKILKPLVRKERNVSIKENKFEAWLAHELSHAWLDYKVDNWTNSGYWNAIDEIFAYFISWEYGASLYTGHEVGYDEDEFIQWGLRITIEKWEELANRGMETNPIDFARKTELRIWNKAERGKDLKSIFLRFCIFRGDIEKLRELNKVEKVTNKDIVDIRRTLIDFARKTEDKDLANEIGDIIHSFDWKNTQQLDKALLENIVDAAEPPEGPESENQHDLNWISQKIDEEIVKEIEKLEKFIELQKKVENKITDEAHLNRIERDITVMKKVEKELKKIANQG